MGRYTKHLCTPLRYFGGKTPLVSKIIPLLPSGTTYVEPYCGSAAVFFAKQPSPQEVLGDLDDRVVNFFRCLQDQKLYKRLKWQLVNTPYALAEFVKALRIADNQNACASRRAWAFFVIANQGFSGFATKLSPGCWSRAFTSSRQMASNVSRYQFKLQLLDACHRRLQNVTILNEDVLELIQQYDTTDTVFYFDPPYLPSTRAPSRGYKCDATVEHHEQLVERLLSLKGQAILSCYSHPIYEILLQHGWQQHDIATACYAIVRGRNTKLRGAGAALQYAPRVETLYILRRDQVQPTLLKEECLCQK